ncbi:hypothetical protein LINPERHAP1_LOCUS7245 [Linum perenne]
MLMNWKIGQGNWKQMRSWLVKFRNNCTMKCQYMGKARFVLFRSHAPFHLYLAVLLPCTHCLPINSFLVGSSTD